MSSLEAAEEGVEQGPQGQAAILSLFSAWDTNGDGVIDPPELTAVLQAMGLDEQAIAVLFDAADTSKDGRIDYQEFVRWVYSDIVPEEVSDMVPKESPSVAWDVAALDALKRDDGRALRLAFLQEGADLTAPVRIEAVAYSGAGFIVYLGDQIIYELHLDTDRGDWFACDYISCEPIVEPSVNKYNVGDDIVDIIVKNKTWDCRKALMTSGLLPFQRRTHLKFGPAAVDALTADDGAALLRACSLPDADLQMEVYIGFRIERYDGAGDEDYHWVNFGEKCIYAFDTCNNGGHERIWSARDYILPDADIIRPNINKYEPCDDLVSLVVKNKKHSCAQALLANQYISETQRARLLLDQAAAHTPAKELGDNFDWDGEWNMTWVNGGYAGKTSTVKVEEGRVGTPVHAAHGNGFDFDNYPLEKETSPVRFVWKDGTVQAVKGLSRNKVVWSTTDPNQPCIVWERTAGDETAQ